MTDVIAFSASPRRGGSSERLLDAAIEGLHGGNAAVEKIWTHDLDIFPCTGCGGCARDGICVVGDAFHHLRERMISCDGIVFASPLYFMNVPARGKALIDRCQSFWIARHRLGLDLFGGRRRFGALIGCSGAGRGPGGGDVFRGLEDTMTYFFDALGLERRESFLVRRLDSPDELSMRPDVLDGAREWGRNLVRKSWGAPWSADMK